ncbi:MAG: hypothetical protein AAF850_05490 [Pseudomonadota bacterium]
MGFPSLSDIAGVDPAAQAYFVTQIALLGAACLVLFCALAVCALAFKAAGAARLSRDNAAADLSRAEDLAIEMRRLTAQVEKTMSTGRSSVLSAEGAAAAVAPASFELGDGSAQSIGLDDSDIVGDGESVSATPSVPDTGASVDNEISDGTSAASTGQLNPGDPNLGEDPLRELGYTEDNKRD